MLLFLGDDDPVEIPPSVFDGRSCEESIAAINAGADVLQTNPAFSNGNFAHMTSIFGDEICLRMFFSLVEDDQTKRDILKAKDDNGDTPYAIAFTGGNLQSVEVLQYLTELAASLGIIEELIGKHAEGRGGNDGGMMVFLPGAGGTRPC